LAAADLRSRASLPQPNTLPPAPTGAGGLIWD
jgi:hypothetical protein